MENSSRGDGAFTIPIPLSGSLQNPAWSPDGQMILITHFTQGYNNEPADLYTFDLVHQQLTLLVSDGSGNVNLPGSAWNPISGNITFSSSREPHDEIYTINPHNGPNSEIRLTQRTDRMSYEPAFSPDGLWITFESHMLDAGGNGIITRIQSDGSGEYIELTAPKDDCRQPNWSPSGDKILYQKRQNGQWDIWVMNTDGTQGSQVTTGSGDKTDASFSPDGKWIVYSSDQEQLEYANLFAIPTVGGAALRVTYYEGYGGAPSWSLDGSLIVFESSAGSPDRSPGTTIWAINAPDVFHRD